MKFTQFSILNYNLVNNFNETPSDKEKMINAIRLKLNYNIAVDKNLYNVLGNKLYGVINKELQHMYDGIENTFYPNFPMGIPDDELTLYFNQFLEYMRLTNVAPIQEDYEEENVLKFKEKLEAKPTRTLSTNDNVKLYVLNDLINTHTNLSGEAYQQLLNLVRTTSNKYSIYSIGDIENRTVAMIVLYGLLENRHNKVNDYNKDVKTLNDVVKYMKVCACAKNNHLDYINSFNDHHSSLGMRSYDYSNIFKMFTYAVTNQGIEKFKMDAKSNLGILKKFMFLTKGKNYKYRKDIIDILYNTPLDSIHKITQRYIENGKYLELAINFPSMFIRNYTKFVNNSNYSDTQILSCEQAVKSLLDCPTRIILQLYNRLNRDKDTPNVYDTKLGLLYRGKDINYKQSSLIQGLLETKLHKGEQLAFEEVSNIIDDEYQKSKDNDETISDYCKKLIKHNKIDFALPTTSKDFSSLLSYPYSKFKLKAKRLSVYLKWYEDVDLDLALHFVNPDGTFDDISYYNQSLPNIDGRHSGDITYNPDTTTPVSERVVFDVDKAIENGYRYVMVDAYVYDGIDFSSCKHTSLGLQDVTNKGKVSFGDNHEDTIIDTPIETTNKQFTWLVIDLLSREVIIVNKPFATKKSMLNGVVMEKALSNELSFVSSVTKTNVYLKDLPTMLNLSKEHEDIISLVSSNSELAKVYLDKLLEC